MPQVWLSLNLVVSLLTSLASESPEVPEDTRNMEIINLLLGKDGIDVNLHPELKSPPLLTAIQWRLVEAVESLFARDDLDLADRRQSMPNVSRKETGRLGRALVHTTLRWLRRGWMTRRSLHT
jgi:hypothetical protein